MAGTYTGYITKIDTAAIPDDLLNEWSETLKGENDRILNHLLTQIPDEASFKNKLATPAADGYEDYVNPNHPKANIAKLKHRLKLGKAYADWNNAVNSAFTIDPNTGLSYFMSQVDAKKDRFRRVAYTLSAVGEKVLFGWNALTKAVMMITGDQRLPYYIDSAKGDSLNGTPDYGIDPNFSQYVKPMLIAKGVFGAIYAFYADEAGDATTRDNIISQVNADFDTIIGAFKNPAFTTVDLSYTWDDVNKRIRVDAVVQV